MACATPISGRAVRELLSECVVSLAIGAGLTGRQLVDTLADVLDNGPPRIEAIRSVGEDCFKRCSPDDLTARLAWELLSGVANAVSRAEQRGVRLGGAA